METIVFIITVVGGIAAIFTIMDYRKNHLEKPNEEIQHLQLQFNMTRSLSMDVKSRLVEYAKTNDAFDEQLFPGVTIRQYIVLLEDSHQGDLSERLMNETLKLPLTSSNIRSMITSLENQFNGLLQIEALVKAKDLT